MRITGVMQYMKLRVGMNKSEGYLLMGLKEEDPFSTLSSAVRHALTLVILLPRSELGEKSIDDEHWSTKDLVDELEPSIIVSGPQVPLLGARNGTERTGLGQISSICSKPPF